MGDRNMQKAATQALCNYQRTLPVGFQPKAFVPALVKEMQNQLKPHHPEWHSQLVPLQHAMVHHDTQNQNQKPTHPELPLQLASLSVWCML